MIAAAGVCDLNDLVVQCVCGRVKYPCCFLSGIKNGGDSCEGDEPPEHAIFDDACAFSVCLH